jgi:hypothetical protein
MLDVCPSLPRIRLDKHFVMASDLEATLREKCTIPDPSCTEARVGGIPIEFSDFMPSEHWMLVQDGRIVAMGKGLGAENA